MHLRSGRGRASPPRATRGPRPGVDGRARGCHPPSAVSPLSVPGLPAAPAVTGDASLPEAELAGAWGFHAGLGLSGSVRRPFEVGLLGTRPESRSVLLPNPFSAPSLPLWPEAVMCPWPGPRWTSRCEGHYPPSSVRLLTLRFANCSAVSGARARVAFTCGRSRSRIAVSLPDQALSPHGAAAWGHFPHGTGSRRRAHACREPRTLSLQGTRAVVCTGGRPRLPLKIRTCILLLSKAVFGGRGF